MDYVTQVITISLTLFAVIDILGSIPIIINLREKLGHIQSFKSTLVSGGIMVSFLFFGEGILELVQLDVSSFAIAGAIVMLLLSLEMILNIELFKEEKGSKAGEIVPIAFPLIAGAGTLTTIISMRAEYNIDQIFLGILVNLIVVFLVLKSTKKLKQWLGKGGISVLRRVFGIILMAISMKLFLTNLQITLQHGV